MTFVLLRSNCFKMYRSSSSIQWNHTIYSEYGMWLKMIAMVAIISFTVQYQSLFFTEKEHIHIQVEISHVNQFGLVLIWPQLDIHCMHSRRHKELFFSYLLMLNYPMWNTSYFSMLHTSLTKTLPSSQESKIDENY